MDKLRRPPIVSGVFYSENKDALETFVKSSLAMNSIESSATPFGIIAPYASYLYSSAAYAASYSQVQGKSYDSVIVISPVHKKSFYGMALSESDIFECPIGELEVDKEGSDMLHAFNEDFIIYDDKYHIGEHSIEVQLPYIISTLGEGVKILPVIMGEVNTRFTLMLSRAIKNLIEKTGKRYLIIATSNLSYDVDHDTAVATDKKFIEILKTMSPTNLAEQLALNQIKAFGQGGIITLLVLAEMFKLDKIDVLKYFTSAEVSEDKNKVEGYLSAVVNM